MALDFLRSKVNRSAIRSVRKRGARIDRFKLTAKSRIREALLADPEIAKAVKAHAHDNDLAADDVWARVNQYIDEIVPFFNIIAYYRFGYFVSRALLNM